MDYLDLGSVHWLVPVFFGVSAAFFKCSFQSQSTIFIVSFLNVKILLCVELMCFHTLFDSYGKSFVVGVVFAMYLCTEFQKSIPIFRSESSSRSRKIR